MEDTPPSPAPAPQATPPRAPAPSQPAVARAPAPQAGTAPRAAAPTATSPRAELLCNEDESKRLLVKFAAAHLPSNKPPASAGAALLEQLAKLLQRAGLEVARNQNGTILISNGQAETLLLFEDGLFGTIKRDRKSFPALPIAWNPFEKTLEGTQPEHEPLPGEAEFRIPRRSALAVLTEAVLQRLSAGDAK